MAERPRNIVAVREWTGLVSNRGPFVCDPGDEFVATELTRLECRVARLGLQVVDYDDVADPGSDGDVISLVMLEKPERNYAVFLTTDGKLTVGNNPQVPA